MVSPNSELYRAHPDWAIHFPTRPRTEARNQLMLNLGRADVQDYLIEKFDRLLTDHKIAYVKWDMNRNVSEPGWPDAPATRASYGCDTRKACIASGARCASDTPALSG